MHAELPSDLLVNVFEFCDGTFVLARLALVCKTWRAVSLDEELWRRLIARRWATLHAREVDVDDLIGPSHGCPYTMQDVYMRLVAMPSHLCSITTRLALSAPPDGNVAAPTLATFTGEVLGGNQTARANAPWACSVAVGMHTDSRFDSPPVGTLRACADGEQLPPGARARQPRPGARAPTRLCAELQLLHYFEATVLPAPEARRVGADGGPMPFSYERSCIAIGMCSARFPLLGKMPGWDRHSFAYHGDDGCRFFNSSHGERYGPPFGEGDTIGCGVRLRPRPMHGLWVGTAPPGGDVFFTLNGTLLAQPHLELGMLSTRPLYPCVGVDSFSPVRVNFGAEPFRFDVRAVHPLSEPSALGMPNPTDRSAFARCIRERLRQSLRPPVLEPAPTDAPPADGGFGAPVEGAPAGAPLPADGQHPAHALVHEWGANEGGMLWALGQMLSSSDDSDDSDDMLDDDDDEEYESEGEDDDDDDEQWSEDEPSETDESGGDDADADADGANVAAAVDVVADGAHAGPPAQPAGDAPHDSG